MAKPETSTAEFLGSRERSSRAGWRELLTPWGDERVRSLSHRGAVSFKYVPSLLLAFRLARAFGVSVEGVFQYDDGEHNSSAVKVQDGT